ncbi:MAG: hypothetical protein IPJ28_23655 [Betaproteobacteria bacterium]|nr:hypothetical protein [Betaproteobacteria bacterium]
MPIRHDHRSLFEDNSAINGGALWLPAGGIIQNTCEYGATSPPAPPSAEGAVYIGDGSSSFAVTGSTFTGNTSSENGGAIYGGLDSQMSISQSTFTGQFGALRWGGAIIALGGMESRRRHAQRQRGRPAGRRGLHGPTRPVRITETIFEGTRAVRWRGLRAPAGSTSSTLSRSIFRNNVAGTVTSD